jgi:hypothetical protein
MSRRFSELVFFLVLGLAIALVPVACGSSNNSDGGDSISSMTHG